jgi:hypothetical protein
LLNRGKTKGFRQAVPRNTPPRERLPVFLAFILTRLSSPKKLEGFFV